MGAARPPLLLVHGAANSSGVWTFWMRELSARGWTSHAIDLRGHGDAPPVDLTDVSMRDYADDVRAGAQALDARPALIGWSMGGLVAMMAAVDVDPVACVCLAPSPPARETDPSAEVRRGVFGPELYGIRSRDPDDQPAMPDLDREEREIALASLCDESTRARDERRAGVAIASLPCPLLIVTGSEDRLWPRAKYDGLHLPADFIEVDGASHWGLVLSRRALSGLVPRVVAWLEG